MNEDEDIYLKMFLDLIPSDPGVNDTVKSSPPYPEHSTVESSPPYLENYSNVESSLPYTVESSPPYIVESSPPYIVESPPYHVESPPYIVESPPYTVEYGTVYGSVQSSPSYTEGYGTIHASPPYLGDYGTVTSSNGSNQYSSLFNNVFSDVFAEMENNESNEQDSNSSTHSFVENSENFPYKETIIGIRRECEMEKKCAMHENKFNNCVPHVGNPDSISLQYPVSFDPSKDILIECLHSYETLKKICDRQGVKFNDYVPYGENINDFSLKYNEAFAPSKDFLCRDVKIKCLERFETLQGKCDLQGVKFNDYVSGTAYEVELILAHKLIEEEIYYYVKWRYYSSDNNTWEPKYHLTHCEEMIEYYHAMLSSKVKLNRKLLQYFIRDLTTRRPYDILTLTKVCALCFDCSEKYVDSLHLRVSQMKQKVKEIMSFPHNKLSKIKNRLFRIMQYAESRKHVLINLKEWEYKINSENQTPYIVVENNVDLETAPSEFEFIHDYINTTVMIKEEPVAFCHCEDCYENKASCCPHHSEGHFAYSKHRRLLLLPGYPIYECNKRCTCSSDCINRVVQQGQKVNVSIFRTSNGCGWGLKTLEPIEKDQFVLEYLGEIITSEAAETRGLIYDYTGRSYLFDLNYSDDCCCYTVDAGCFGNAAHFINHSCDPNLHVFAVWINQQNPKLPRVAFFAKRKIKRGEELTFDYKMIQRDRFGPLTPVADNERILCRCNSKNCRKFLF